MDERRTPRVVVDLNLDGFMESRACRVAVYDLSMDGCSIQIDGEWPIQAGSCVTLKFPGGVIASGSLAWVNRRNGGVQFAARLPEALVTDLAFAPGSTVEKTKDRSSLARPQAFGGGSRTSRPPL